MAYLISPHTKHPVYLKSFHQFGRLPSAVVTLIDSPDISRIHAIIEWVEGFWYIRDLSKNGVLLNNKKILANTLYRLSLSDNICFSEQKNISFMVDNLDKPKDALIPYIDIEKEEQPAKFPILLEHYHFLPSESSPEIIVFYDICKKSWFCENVIDGSLSKILDGELIKFSQSMWVFTQGAAISEQETMLIDATTKQCLSFVFNISQDEELTELTLKNNNDEISCDIRSHHYLTALLARYRRQDSHKSLPDHEQGWRSIEQLTKDMGLSESHVNIQIHRARKQVACKLQSLGLHAPLLIERKKGQVRFAATDYKIYKGSVLEQDYMNTEVG